MNITEKRLTVLQAVAAVKDGVYACFIAECLPRPYGWTAQGATRFGCGYAQPLVNAGYLAKNSRVQHGGAIFTITEKGKALLAAHAAEQNSLDAVLARAVDP